MYQKLSQQDRVADDSFLNQITSADCYERLHRTIEDYYKHQVCEPSAKTLRDLKNQLSNFHTAEMGCVLAAAPESWENSLIGDAKS